MIVPDYKNDTTREATRAEIAAHWGRRRTLPSEGQGLAYAKGCRGPAHLSHALRAG